MSSKGKGELLARVNFPLYVAKMLSSRHLIVAGGGGSAKTGIANAVEIYELGYNGKHCYARPATRYETGEKAVMNGTVWFDGKDHILAVGLEGDCQLYKLKYKLCHPEGNLEIIKNDTSDKNSQTKARKRQKSQSEREIDKDSTKEKENNSNKESLDDNSNKVTWTLGFEVSPVKKIQTDFCNSVDGPGQKVVRMNAHSLIMATGGFDGCVRLWKYPDMNKVGTLKAHEQEVDDLDIMPLGNRIVSVSRDTHAFIWDVKELKRICQLEWSAPQKVKYRFRNCRFGIVEDDYNKVKLFTAQVPVARQKNLPCYIVKWDTEKYIPEKVVSVGLDFVSAMAVSDNGKFLAIGTMMGGVDIYISFSLQKLQSVRSAHNSFITGLEFLPCTEESWQVVGIRDTSLISVSVDNQIKIHHIDRRATISVTWVLLMIFIILFFTFTLMTYLGL